MFARRDLAVVAGLIALSCLVQAVLIFRAVVPALDTVHLVAIGQRIEEFGLRATLRKEAEQPLFPVLVWLAHLGLAGAMGDFPSSWALSAQLVAAAALVLTAVPLYFVSLRLVGRPGAIAGTVLFCVLPEVSRLGADGIGDSTHLLFFSLSLWAVVRYLAAAETQGSSRPLLREGLAARAGNPVWLIIAGCAAGMALLARAETLVLGIALAVTLTGSALARRDQLACREAAVAAGCLATGFGLLFAPYLAWIGACTPHAALCRVLGRSSGEVEAAAPSSPTPFFQEERGDTNLSLPSQGHGAIGKSPCFLPSVRLQIEPIEKENTWVLSDGEPMSFAAKDPTISIRRHGWDCVVKVGDRLTRAIGYWTGPLALLGAWSLWRRAMRRVDWFAAVFCILYLLLALVFSLKEGYLESRHFVLVVAVGIGSAGYGSLELGKWIAGGFRPASRKSHCERGQRAGWLVVGVAAAGCLVYWTWPLHRTQLGHRAAGEWLARNAAVPGAVLDTQGWTGLYSGRRTYPYVEAPRVLADRRLAYLVVEDRELDLPSSRARTLRRLLEAAQPCVAFSSPAGKRAPGFRVLVYRWFPERVGRLALN